MLPSTKKKILEQARAHIVSVRSKIMKTVGAWEARMTRMAREAIKMLPGDALTERKITAHYQERAENLKQLYPSPYFTKCEFEVDGVKKPMYFAKFSFSEENIYSWITPAAALRFENPGPASYQRPDGSRQSGVLLGKDQYMIVEGRLLFFTTEGVAAARELIYQENFTRRKTGFVLPEVVEQMEKAQDQIIRAPYQGPFVISGPAGSGKTTLALHRVAYLIQSPETAEYFPPETILVLVQDEGTKEYFSHLLPELGIRSVSIMTFPEWAMGALALQDYQYVARFGATENEKILYEQAKLQALRKFIPVHSKNIFLVLQKIYKELFAPEQREQFARQKKERLLDRFDLTVLLQNYQQTVGDFVWEKNYYVELSSGAYRKRTGRFPMAFNLMVIDEFQNYLPEQLQLFRTCLNRRIDSMIYVGDLAQQTQLGTIRQWPDIGETIKPERLVTLQKVYRNTKQILEYINGLGYRMLIPEEIKDGKAVTEIIVENTTKEVAIISETLQSKGDMTVGILSKERAYLDIFKETFGGNKNVFCLSFQEAQGVEFDVVFIVGINRAQFDFFGLPENLLPEIKQIQRDSLYVALTRAISELYILGKDPLRFCFNDKR